MLSGFASNILAVSWETVKAIPLQVYLLLAFFSLLTLVLGMLARPAIIAMVSAALNFATAVVTPAVAELHALSNTVVAVIYPPQVILMFLFSACGVVSVMVFIYKAFVEVVRSV